MGDDDDGIETLALNDIVNKLWGDLPPGHREPNAGSPQGQKTMRRGTRLTLNFDVKLGERGQRDHGAPAYRGLCLPGSAVLGYGCGAGRVREPCTDQPTTMPTRTILALVLGAQLVAQVSSAAPAKPSSQNQGARPGASLKPAAGPSAKDLEARLAESDASADAALQEVAKLDRAVPRPALAPPIEALLRRGTSLGLAKSAAAALEQLGAPSSSEVLATYIGHRTPDVRRAAVRALIRTKGPAAIAAFRAGLKAEDPVVRGFSATGLGALGAKDSIEDLFLALDRNVPEAASAIGQLCGPTECERYLAKMGKLSFDVMTSGIDPMLFREPSLPEPTVLSIVAALRELGTGEARRYLEDVQARWSVKASKKVKQAVDSSITSLPTARKPKEMQP